MNQKLTPYFGYGILASPEALFAILEEVIPYTRTHAIGEQLVIISAEDIPTKPEESLGGKSVAEVVLSNWQNSGKAFKSYDLAIGTPNSSVSGLLLMLTPKQLDTLANLEFVPFWLKEEIVELEDGTKAITFTSQRAKLASSTATNGIDYDPFLMGKNAAMEAIKGFRTDYESKAAKLAL